MTQFLAVVLLGLALVATGAAAHAQAKPDEPKAAEPKPAEKPKTLWEETTLFSYLESSYVWNTAPTGRGNHNELRLYDFNNNPTPKRHATRLEPP